MHIKQELTGTRFVVVAGGVISGVGKGVATASIGKIFKEYGFKTTIIKIDPYINFDAGTLRPTEHGEVWVTADGGEIDQDLGTYERFLDEDIAKVNNITTGQIYKAVIDRERRGEYLGHTVQFIPHIIDEVIARIKLAAQGYDIVVVEIGGTVGDYENAPFLYALKSLERDLGPQRIIYALVTYLPVPGHIGEMKTKPTQQAIKLLNEHGISPDFVICRVECPLDEVRRRKIVEFSHIDPDHVIAAPNVQSVYEVPLAFEEQKLGAKMLAQFGITASQEPEWDLWRTRVRAVINPQKKVKIGIVGKYLNAGAQSLTDSYLSVCHAIVHAGAAQGYGIEIAWIDARDFEKDPAKVSHLAHCDGIVVPGGFGDQGVEGKIAAIAYARATGIPFLGLCYGFQLAVVEYARTVCQLAGAHTTEVAPQTLYPVITLLPLQQQLLSDNKVGGSMRLGSYGAMIKPHTLVAALYRAQGIDTPCVYERHRHRYEVNPAYVPQLEAAGLSFSGSFRVAETRLMEYLELPQHPFFVATQAHPEFTSKFMRPNALFYGLVEAAAKRHDQLHLVAQRAQTLQK